MVPFEWSSQFVTGLPLVDEQHQILVRLINAYGDLVSSGEASPADHEALINRLYEYADLHFRDEDALAVAQGIDPRHLAAHRAEHARFLADVGLAAKRVVMGSLDASGLLLGLMVHWLAYHILVQDQNMARQIEAIRGGRSAAEAFETQQREAVRETGPLVSALLGLFEQVSAQNRELHALTDTLEARVAERTSALSNANRLLEELAMTDALTGLPNRRHGMARLAMLWAEAVERGAPLAALMIDGDGFKQVNDTYGHVVGDAVLCKLARILAEAVRTDDVVCRLGGDEFLVVCPSTDHAGAVVVAETLVSTVREHGITVGELVWQGSVSVGVAVRTPATSGWEALLSAADRAVYEAKSAGRGCVRVATT